MSRYNSKSIVVLIRQLQYKSILLIIVLLMAMPQGSIDSYGPLQSQEIIEENGEQLIDLLDYIRKYNLRLSWDSIYNIGLISAPAYNVVVSFQPGLSIVLINFQKQRIVKPVIKKQGKLYASPQFLDMLYEVLITRTHEDDLLDTDPSLTSNPSASTPSQTTNDDVDSGKDIQNTVASSSASRTMTNKANFSKIVTLVIDAGHGGKTPGAVGRFTYNDTQYVLMEKDVVLDIALRVRDSLIELYPNIHVVMTREYDEDVSLEDRTILANKYLGQLKEGEGMMFVSIHANAALTKKANGYEVWYLPPDYRRDNLVSENFNDNQIYSIINNIREEEITLESIQLATLVINGLTEQFGSSIRNRGVKEEKFYVVKNAKMPAILIEVGFVTNPEEGYMLTQNDHKHKIANGIVNGIHQYLQLFQ